MGERHTGVRTRPGAVQPISGFRTAEEDRARPPSLRIGVVAPCVAAGPASNFTFRRPPWTAPRPDHRHGGYAPPNRLPPRRRPRRHLQRDGPGVLPPHRLRRRRHPSCPPCVRHRLQSLRRRVREPRGPARSLPGVRRGVPPLRTGVQRPDQLPGLTAGTRLRFVLTGMSRRPPRGVFVTGIPLTGDMGLTLPRGRSPALRLPDTAGKHRLQVGQPAALSTRSRTCSSSRWRLSSRAACAACSPGSWLSSKNDRCTVTSLTPLSMPAI